MIDPSTIKTLSIGASTMGFELVCDGVAAPTEGYADAVAGDRKYALLRQGMVAFDGTASECAAFLSREITTYRAKVGLDAEYLVVSEVPRDKRQEMVARWAEKAFGREQATSLAQRGLRLLEEAAEAFQACGGDESMAHKIVTFVFSRPAGTVGQELGGVAVTTLALAAAAGLSADEEECKEIERVLSKPVAEFTARNASKNAAGFQVSADEVRQPCPCCGQFCCGRAATYRRGDRDVCTCCGREVPR